MAGILNNLGQRTAPKIFAKLAAKGLVDTMSILGEGKVQGPGGGMVKGSAPAVYSNVPVSYEPASAGKRIAAGDQDVSSQQYVLTLPTHQNGTRINLDPSLHRLSVNARGNEPVKVFRILAVGDVSGVVFEVIAEREN